MKFLEKERKQ